MKMRGVNCFLVLCLLLSGIARAEEQQSRYLLRAWAYSYQFDKDDFYTTDWRDSGAGMLGRLMHDRIEGGATVSVALQYATMSDVSTGVIGSGADVERSNIFSWRHTGDSYSVADIDRLYLGYNKNRLSASIGRMAINLSRTFYFSPNDFFVPFAAQSFYREHKAGVDALRFSWEPVELTRLSLLSVEGYEADVQSATGWSARPVSDRRSYLASISTAFGNAEIGVLGGHVRDARIVGASLQTGLGDLFDLRAEGHVAEPDVDRQLDVAQWSIGLGYRPDSDMDFRIEYYRHGRGATESQDYNLFATDSTYLGRHYMAMGMVYQWSAITTFNAMALANQDDDSGLISINLVRSLSDESDMDISLSMPYGQRSDSPVIESEYGLYPASLAIEWRSYF
ncbi:MAG: hypothetical protein IME93_07465 [Proteobacteria bacterium]|nr:hypothetical protein [Pseudomonadota bacterium]